MHIHVYMHVYVLRFICIYIYIQFKYKQIQYTSMIHSDYRHCRVSTCAKPLLERKTKRCGSDSRFVKSQSMPSWLRRRVKGTCQGDVSKKTWAHPSPLLFTKY